MGKWVNKKVKELCQIGRGRVISQEEIQNKPGIYPVYSSQSMNKGEMGRIDRYDFEGEYVTWTTDGAYAGTVFHRTGKFNCTNVCGTLNAKVDDELDLLFLSYLLSTESKKHVSYVGNPKLMNGVMGEIGLNLPEDKPEQTRIAHILSTADKAIDQTEAMIAKYQRIKTGLVQDLLTKGIDEHGNIRSDQTHHFKTEKGLRVPEEWEVNEFQSFCEKVSVGIATSSSDYFAVDGVLFLRNQNIKENIISLDDVVYITKSFAELNKSKYLKAFDIITVRTGYPGMSAVVPLELEGAQSFTTLISRPNKWRANSQFMAYCLNSDFGKRQVKNLQGGGAQQNLNAGALSKLILCMPKKDEQDKIVNKISKWDKHIIQLQKQLEKLHSLKTGLMQDLLSGKVRVTINEQ